MVKRAGANRRWRMTTGMGIAVLTAIVAAMLGAAGVKAGGEGNVFVVHNLVSDQPGVADRVDPNLVNGWGLTRLAGSPWWVADNGQDVSTLYRGDGTPQSLVVSVESAPTGAVANGGGGFVVHKGAASGAARFIFATENGQILGWNPNVPAPSSTQATLGTAVPGAIFKGLALASTPSGDRLYATDFHNGRVDVFDSSFNMISVPGGFADPFLPPGFAPFGIQNVGGHIFVTFAHQDADAKDELHGPGEGFVDMFDTDGNLLRQVATRGSLNAPWGITQAPEQGFGKFSGDLLVGNFGDGRILAFRPYGNCGHVFGRGISVETPPAPCFLDEGPLRGDDHRPISIDGLWGIGFGAGNANSGPATTLFFAAGPDDESHGLFGTVAAG